MIHRSRVEAEGIKDGERMMVSLGKRESEAEESVWQRFCSEMDVLLVGQAEEGTRQAGRQRRGEGSEPAVSRGEISKNLAAGIMTTARSMKGSTQRRAAKGENSGGL